MAIGTSIDPRYQLPVFGWDRMDPILKKCLTASSIAGLVVLMVILLAPALPEKPKTLDNVSERIARLIIEKPKPVPAAKNVERVATAEPPKGIEEEKPLEQPKPKAQPRRTAQEPECAAHGVGAGRCQRGRRAVRGGAAVHAAARGGGGRGGAGAAPRRRPRCGLLQPHVLRKGERGEGQVGSASSAARQAGRGAEVRPERRPKGARAAAPRLGTIAGWRSAARPG